MQLILACISAQHANSRVQQAGARRVAHTAAWEPPGDSASSLTAGFLEEATTRLLGGGDDVTRATADAFGEINSMFQGALACEAPWQVPHEHDAPPWSLVLPGLVSGYARRRTVLVLAAGLQWCSAMHDRPTAR